MKRVAIRYAVLFASAIIFIFLIFQSLGGGVADFLLGEEYYIFAPAALSPTVQAVVDYTLENGRPVEAIYWTLTYKLIGFQPLVLHFLSFGLVYLGSLLAAFALANVWPQKSAKPRVFFLMLLLSFFTAHALIWGHTLSGDNSRIANVMFWGTVLMMQKWAASGFDKRLFVGAILIFFAGLFTYESIAFLFPAAVLLGLSVPGSLSKIIKDPPRVRGLVLITVVSLFFVLIPHGIYTMISYFRDAQVAHPAVDFLNQLSFKTILRTVQAIARYLFEFGNTNSLHRGLIGFVFVLVLWFVPGFFVWRNSSDIDHKNRKLSKLLNPWVLIYFSAVMILIMGFALRALQGEVIFRGYVSAVMGIPILFVLLFELVGRRWMRLIAAGLMVAWATTAIWEFRQTSLRYAEFEATYSERLISLIELVPNVQPNTWFVFVGTELSGLSGCGPSLEILYLVPNLHCAFLGQEPYRATRYAEDVLEADYWGGWIRSGNIILVGGNSRGDIIKIIPEITPADELNIIWIDNTPIRTDLARILPPSDRLSPMAMYLFKEQAENYK